MNITQVFLASTFAFLCLCVRAEVSTEDTSHVNSDELKVTSPKTKAIETSKEDEAEEVDSSNDAVLDSEDNNGRVDYDALEQEPGKVMDLISIGLRLDTSFSIGGAIQQGFQIPSLRFTTFGNITEAINYRVSFGQTREFSSAQLPQLLPVDAWVQFSSLDPNTSPDTALVKWKLGMFTPTFNPWWSDDLAAIDVPDYCNTHQMLFLSKDLGTELSYEYDPDGSSVGVGVFNGNGIVGLNSNNSRAFSVFGRQLFSLTEGSLEIGWSMYALFQSSRGSVNYKSNWGSDLYASLGFPRKNTNFMVDFFFGTLEDSVRIVQPMGAGLTTTIGLNEQVRALFRLEGITHAPSAVNTGPMYHLQAGPILRLHDNVLLFTYYDYLNYGKNSSEHSFQVRARINI